MYSRRDLVEPAGARDGAPRARGLRAGAAVGALGHAAPSPVPGPAKPGRAGRGHAPARLPLLRPEPL